MITNVWSRCQITHRTIMINNNMIIIYNFGSRFLHGLTSNRSDYCKYLIIIMIIITIIIGFNNNNNNNNLKKNNCLLLLVQI